MSRTDKYLQEVSEIASKLDRTSIDKAIGILYHAWQKDNQVFTIGNGGSALLRGEVNPVFAINKNTRLGVRRS